MPKYLENNCHFQTPRLEVVGYTSHVQSQSNRDLLTTQIMQIMSPKVTENLPSGWQGINTSDSAEQWLSQINSESSFLLVKLKSTNEIIGFVFLYEPDDIQPTFDIRLGYLISEQYWGTGIGGELIKGLLTFCRSSGVVGVITGGVEADNIGSIKVLEKNGFVHADSNDNGVLFYEYDCH